MANELLKSEAAPLAKKEPSIGEMMKAVIDGGVTKDAVEVMAKLCELRNQEDLRNAKRDFASAFVELQAEMPVIQPTQPVPNKDGTLRYKYAPYDAIMKQVAPLLKKWGFTLSFSTQVGDGRVTAFCTLMHRGGHERTNQYAVRIGGGPPGSTETQADGAAYTYAQRGALCDALGITVAGKDTDARDLGAPVTDDQAEDLRQRVQAGKVNESSFLKWCQAVSFETIPAAMYDKASTWLKKEKGV